MSANASTEYQGDEMDLKAAVRALWGFRWWAVVAGLCGGLVAMGAYRLIPAPGPTATVVLVPLAGTEADWLAKTREILELEFKVKEEKVTPPAALLVVTRYGKTEADASAALLSAIRETQARLLSAQRQARVQALHELNERVAQTVTNLSRRTPRDGTTAYWTDVKAVAQEIVTLTQAQADGERIAVVGMSVGPGGWRVRWPWWIVLGLLVGAGFGISIGWLKQTIQEG